jgi:hypothetical protein
MRMSSRLHAASNTAATGAHRQPRVVIHFKILQIILVYLSAD